MKRVALPGGKMIEVVHFQDVDSARHPAAPSPGQELHVCPDCGSGLVYPVAWEEAGVDHWEVTLRCPNCEWSETGRFEQEVVERFDDELDRGTNALIDDLKRLIYANMEEQIERFSQALAEDHVLPEDF